MKIIGIAGRKGSGKDTFAAPLLQENEGVFFKVKFADPLKNMLRSLFHDAGCSATQLEEMIEGQDKENEFSFLGFKTPRYAMQSLGTEWRNFLTPDLWTGITESRIIKLARGGTQGVVITDVRFPHEVDFVHRLGGKVFRIHGKDSHNALSEHPSEKLVDDLVVDGEIYNYGTIDALHGMAIVVSDAVGNSNI